MIAEHDVYHLSAGAGNSASRCVARVNKCCSISLTLAICNACPVKAGLYRKQKWTPHFPLLFSRRTLTEPRATEKPKRTRKPYANAKFGLNRCLAKANNGTV